MVPSSPAMLLVPVTAVALIILLILLFVWRFRDLLERESAREQSGLWTRMSVQPGPLSKPPLAKPKGHDWEASRQREPA